MDTKNGFNQKISFATLLITLGIVYGDICTSPLYTFKAIISTNQINEMLVLGGVSCIIWTLTLQTTVKYVWITLKADNHGEGGIFSLYALVRRYGKKILIPTMIGAAALLADGFITPAVTVTSAIEGLTMIPGLEDLNPIPIVVLIVSAIFFAQRFGSQKIGRAFGPIMFLWLSFLFILGVNQIVHYPQVLRAINPYYAYDLLVNYPEGFWILGAVFLCTTGAEALYSDIGHCGVKNIRVSWVYVKICLIVNYFGQAAWLMNHIGRSLNGRNPFFEIVPHWFLFFGIILATMAAIVASQSLISGSFTLISEAINLNLWQRVKIKQPTEIKGQVYIPSVNTILWVGCVFVIYHFQTSSRMEAAYGLAIVIAMMMTTYLLFYFLYFKLKWNKIFIVALFIALASIELSFFIANAAKFNHGGYITILFGTVFFLMMYVNYFGRKINDRYTKYVDLKEFVHKITQLSDDKKIPKFVTHLIYLSKSKTQDRIEFRAIQSIFARTPKRADVYWFFHINRTNSPYTLDYQVKEIADDKIIKITLNIGFKIRPRTELYFTQIINELIANKELNLHLRNHGSTKYNPGIDFKFIMMNKFLSVQNDFSLKEGLILDAYFFLKRLGQKSRDAFGIDASVVVNEPVPVLFQPIRHVSLKRRAPK